MSLALVTSNFAETLASINQATRSEMRSSLENPATPLSYPNELLLDMFNGGRTDAGVRVSEYTALQVATVFACVRLLASSVGTLPLAVMELLVPEDTGEPNFTGRPAHRVAFDHDLFDLLRYEPNPEMTAIAFRETLQAHSELWGNGYAEIVRNGANKVIGIWPRNPSRTRPVRTSKGLLVYKTSDGIYDVTDPNDSRAPEGPERTIFVEDMLHIPGLSLDGRLAEPVVWLSRQAIGLAMATEKHGAKFFANGARPGGILMYPGKLDANKRQKIRESWNEANSGENVHRVALMENGMDWKDVSTVNTDAQFLETRQYQRGDICSIFGVPPHMIGDTEKSNRANTEQLGLEFLTYSLGHRLEKWQQELRKKLFPKTGRTAGRFYAHFDTQAFRMPDAAARQAFYDAGKQWGWLSTNDIREMEKLNPVKDKSADAYWMPINMQDAANPLTPAPANDDQAGKTDPSIDQDAADKLGKRFVSAYSRLFSAAFGSLADANKRDSATIRRCLAPVLLTVGEQIFALTAGQFKIDGDSGLESSRFFADYMRAIEERLSDQTADGIRSVADRELRRAVRSFTLHTFEDLGTRRAKPQLQEA